MKENTKDITLLRQDPEFFFKLGMKYADRKMFDRALRFMKTAVEIVPTNSDYQFNLACILAELKETEKSNRILKQILKNIDSTFYECYFCIGCNYFDLGNINKARGYFKKYISMDPEGRFSAEAHEIIFYLQAYDKTMQKSNEICAVGSVWKKEWDQIIECALKNKEFSYKADYKNELKIILKRYVSNMLKDGTPVIRKLEAWAAALEYIYCSMHLIKVSKKGLAKKYRISPSSLYSKLKKFSM